MTQKGVGEVMDLSGDANRKVSARVVVVVAIYLIVVVVVFAAVESDA